jgi:branched-subunit amino acid transport protein
MSCLPDWKGVALFGGLGAAGGLVGAGATALLTKSSVVGGMLCGGAFLPVALITAFALDDVLPPHSRDGLAWKISKFVLEIVAGFAAGVAASAALTTLVGVPLTLGTMTLINFSVTLVGVGLVVLLHCCDEQPASRPIPLFPSAIGA